MVKKHSDTTGLKLKLVLFSYTAVSLMFVVRLFFIQVVSHDKYRTMAQNQYSDSQLLTAKRGTIYSKEGYPLATTELSYLMYAEPKKISNVAEVADKIAQALSVDTVVSKDDVYTDLFKKYKKMLEMDLFWVGLEKNLTPTQKEKIEALNIKGIGFENEPMRYYPEGNLLSHVLGFVASNEKGEKQGYYGIEGLFDGELKGKPGRIIQEKDALGEPILVGGYTRVPPINGGDIYLTVDRAIQYIVEKRLKEGVEKYDAISGSVIVMNPATGDIVALANYPTYNPQKFDDDVEADTLSEEPKRKNIERRDLAISETYEPGSVIKALTMASAVDLGKVSPTTTFSDDGPVNYSGHFINNWDGKHWGVLNMIQLLQKSNNIGAAWVGHQVGAEKLYSYFSNFGLGVRTGVDLEGEDSGILRDASEWTDIDLAAAAFGQGLSTTPLQVLNGFNVLANGGKLMRPRIVYKIITDGKVIESPVKMIRQVISKATSDTVTDMLIQTVDGGESKYFNLKTYNIAGKTGTAQIPVNGKYDPQKTNATFVGYLSGTKKFSMIVRLNEPKTSIYAAETAVPLWMLLADDLVKYYGIPQDKIPAVTTTDTEALHE